MLISAFSMLKRILRENNFFSRGKTLRPALIITDNCSQFWEALGKTWNSELFLCLFHLLQQVWRWLYHTKNRIAKTDRPMLLSLFKKLVYVNELSEMEEFYDDLQSADIVLKYPDILTYVNTAYEGKGSWALPYRKTSLTRGSYAKMQLSHNI